MGEVKKELPQGWVETTLGEIATKIVDGSHNPPKAEVTGLPMMSAKNVGNGMLGFDSPRLISEEHFLQENARTEIVPGDVLVTIVGAVGRSAVVPQGTQRFTVQRSVAIIKQNSCIPDFLSLQLRSPDLQEIFEEKASGTAQKGVYLKTLGHFPVLLPPVGEQKRIVEKITRLQTHSRRAREALESIPDLMEQLRQSILEAAFRGDLTKKWREDHPDVEPASELLKRIRTERRKRWEESELEKLKKKGLTGEALDSEFANRRKMYQEPESVDATDLPHLPLGWCWTSWAGVGFCQNGRAFPSKHYAPAGTKLLRPGNLHVSGRIEWTAENTRRLPDEWAQRYQDYIVGPGEIAANLTAQSLKDEFLGRVCLTPPDERCLLNQRLARLTPVELSAEFCLWLFKSPLFRRFVDTLNTGSLIQHMFTTQIDEFAFPLPPLREQEAIVQLIGKMLRDQETLLDSVRSAHNELEKLDQSILSKAFRGELVPQDPNDEPAAMLLDRIRQNRASAVDEKNNGKNLGCEKPKRYRNK